MTKNKSELIFGGTIIASVGYLLSKLIGYLYKIVISKLGAATFGSFSLGFSFIAILETFSVGGMGQGLTRYIPYLENNNKDILPLIRETIKKVFIRSVVITILFILFFPYVVNYSHNIDIIHLKYWLGLGVIVLAQMELLLMVLVGLRRIKIQGLINYILEPILRILIAMIVINIGLGLYGIIAGFSISNLLVVIIVYLIIIKNIPPGNSNALSGTIEKEFGRYSNALFALSMINNLMIWLPLIFLSRFSDPATVGNFGVILPTAQMATILGAGLSMYFLPVVTNSIYKGEDNRSFLSNCLKYELILLTLPIIILCLNSNYILEYLFGAEFLSASKSLIIVSVIYGFYIYSTIYEKIILAKEQTNKLLIAAGIGLFVFIVAMIWLIPIYKLGGAAVALGMGFFVRALLTILFSQKKYIKLLPCGVIAKIAVISVVIIAVNYYWKVGGDLTDTIINISVLTILYLSGLIYAKVISFQELTTIFKYSKNILVDIKK